jgi:hypothetical protein
MALSPRAAERNAPAPVGPKATPAVSSDRQWLCDALGLLAILLVLLDYFRPALLFLPTIAAGGDTPCHYPTFVWFKEHLLPQGRLSGWYPGAYLGQPLLLYYFPLPFLVMSALAPVFGDPVAFKLGTVLPVFLLPLLTYASFRLLGFRFPGPLLGAGAAAVFLFHEENPIWGGTLGSTLTGEFSYTYGLGLATLFLGVLYRLYTRGKGPIVPALLLGVVAFAHGYAVLWAGLSATYFLYGSRKPWRTLRFLVVVAVLAFATAGILLVPLLSDWGWTTPYNDPWITVTTLGLLPTFLWPLFAIAVAGLVFTLVLGRRTGGPDHRLLFLGHAALVGAALAAAGPALGVIDVRFVPFAQFAACLLAGATLGLALERTYAKDLLALGIVLVGLMYGDARSQVLRHWIDWNYTGLEAKELWPAFRRLADLLRGGIGDPRVAVEYSPVHERAGSIRMYETLPYFSGRSTLEGVYNQASLTTHSVYYLASELGATSPNPFREIDYGRFDPDAAIDHLRLFAVSDVVALSPKLVNALEGRPGVTLVERIAPYSVFRLGDGRVSYVEPVRVVPVRSSPRGWRDKALRWFTRRPLPAAPLVFTDDARVGVPEPDPWLPPPETPIGADVRTSETVEPESLTIRTDRPGHPLLVKIAWHPRWKAEGALGPYLVAPALMLVVPQQETIRLSYMREGSDRLGLLATMSALVVATALALRRRRPPVTSPVSVPIGCADDLPAAPRRWGGVIPAALVLLLFGARLLHSPRDRSAEAAALYELASKAYSEERYPQAAEYAGHAARRGQGTPLRDEMLCLRGESLLRSGQPQLAVEAFETLLGEAPESPYAPQALFGRAAAREASGDEPGARSDRARLLSEHSGTPWAKRLAPSTP